MDDKFILMGLDDERSKDVAEVLGNKTCKTILDFLSERKEASEKDIADGLNMKINTVEYNLNKLVKSGLVEKTKNFFWSTKGRKIDMYKLAKRHIIISPKSRKPSLESLRAVLPVFLAIIGFAVILGLILSSKPIYVGDQTSLKQFTSYNELKNFLKENLESYSNYYGVGGVRTMDEGITAAAPSAGAESSQQKGGGGGAEDYSQTNIQVEGVDEPDIVKNDGKYIYTVTGNKVVIVDAYPASSMKILGEIEFNDYISNIFVNGNKLIIFANGYGNVYSVEKCAGTEKGCIVPDGHYSEPRSLVYIYNIEDRENPVLEDEISITGNYIDSRMINNYVYVISTKYAEQDVVLPVYSVNSVETQIKASEIYYFDYPDSNYVFTSITALNLDDNKVNDKVYLTGASSNLYVSNDNIYLTYQKQINYKDYFEDYIDEVVLEILPVSYKVKINQIIASDKQIYEKMDEVQELVYEYSNSLQGDKKSEFDEKLMNLIDDFEIEIQKKTEKTIIHKINIDKLDIEYKKAGEIPGHVLNQFSMDEYDGNFRIATTTGNTWQGNSLNYLYVLNKDLKIIGKVEDLAKGEQIYSARFLGDKAYIVTFRQIDPFYVINLKNPENPEVLGYLKIPGYSSYLHPYDENHIIGLGQENNQLKLSLFDVSDFDNPVEAGKYIVDKKYSYSEALYDYKAFLFDKEKNLLVIPVTYSEQIGVDSQYGYARYKYFQGAFVFDIDSNSIELKGKISHEDNIPESQDYYYGNYQTQVTRSLFMDDILYTISLSKIKANDLDDLTEIKDVQINEFENPPLYYATDVPGGSI